MSRKTLVILDTSKKSAYYVSMLEKAAAETVEAYKRGELIAFDNPNDLLDALHQVDNFT